MQDALGAVQSILVLGGTSDIAVATVRRLASPRRARVLLAGRYPERMPSLPGDVDTIAFDALDADSHDAFVKEAFERLGDVDVVLVAFGVLGKGAEQDPAAAVDVLRTNFLGAGSLLLLVGRRMQTQGHGSLVLFSSVAGERVRKSNFVYGASKAGVDGLAQGLGDALHGTGVQVMVVRPGFVTTKMTEGLDRAPLSTTPEAVATAVVRGLKKGSSTIWVPPALRFVMAGLRHLPRPVFRRLEL
jgi:decaprenylphospho-beta-D-erythro-pentofuranosid-2-ulose 2-reductase